MSSKQNPQGGSNKRKKRKQKQQKANVTNNDRVPAESSKSTTSSVNPVYVSQSGNIFPFVCH